MASVFFRGPKAAPRWYARYRDPAGVWRSLRVRVESRKDATAIARQLEAQSERRRYGIEPPEQAGTLCGPLLRAWGASLANRSAAQDLGRLENYVWPHFAAMRLVDVGLPTVLAWADEMRVDAKIGPQSQRHCLNLLSRFFGWAVGRGIASSNPCRMIPPGRRPQQAPKRSDVPWIDADETVVALMRALPEPFDLMFWIGNRSGLRLGEIAGLRLSDVDDLAAGAFRVRYSYDGPLKEDKAGAGKVKWTPAPGDAASVLGPWIERRRAEGAIGEAFLFERPGGGCWNAASVGHRWEGARIALGLGSMTFYQATRHSFASRNLSRGAPLDEVAAALGHSTPAITARHYAHFIRRTFSPIMTAGIGGGPGGRVIPITSVRATEPLAQLETNESQVSHG